MLTESLERLESTPDAGARFYGFLVDANTQGVGTNVIAIPVLCAICENRLLDRGSRCHHSQCH
jgi:hypothetical protein